MKTIIATIACAVLVGAVQAQTQAGSTGKPAAAPSAPDNSNDEASERRRVEDHIEQLHKELRITAAQEPQWETVAKTMRENAEDIDRAIDKREASRKSATAVDDLNSYADVVQAHAQAVKRLADTFTTLYSEMSDSQKRTADEVFSHRHRERIAARN